MRIGWFSPISSHTGIATYTQTVLEEMARLHDRSELDVVVFHPPTTDEILDMPYPTIALGEDLLQSDFDALFDIAVYHLGNNAKNHEQIYAALMRHPGVIVMHDYVYQHYIAGLTVADGFVGASYGSMVFSCGGPQAFEFLAESRILRCDKRDVAYVPWESGWATTVPMGDKLARLGVGAVVHSDYARAGLGPDYPAPASTLFLPRAPVSETLLSPLVADESRPVHLVFCGHIGPTKGLGLLTGAIAASPTLRARIRVTIAGFASDAAYLEEFQQLLRAQELQDVFTLRIGLGEKAFQKTMSTADVFYNLRYPNTEGGSLSLVEQLAFGRPVIAYRSGCFAEVPDDAAYFLEQVGDEAELRALLERIAADPADLARRAAAASHVVEDKTAEVYAREIVDFLRSNRDLFERRTGLAAARRRRDGKAHAGQEDARWMEEFVGARQLLTKLRTGRLYVPDGFFEATAAEKGAFFALNLLHSRPGIENQRRIGEMLEALDPAQAHEFMGRMLMLARMPFRPDTNFSAYLSVLFLPDFDPRLWRLLTLLGDDQAVLMAVCALGREVNAEAAKLVEQARRKGFRAALLDFLMDADWFEMENRAAAGMLEVLGEPELEVLERLEPVPLGEELTEFWRGDDDGDTRLTTGCNSEVEEVGLWTLRRKATIRFRTEDDARATRLSGILSLFTEAVEDGETITVELVEEATGRRAAATLDYEADGTKMLPLDLELPEFHGPLRLTLGIGELYSPSDVKKGDDTRRLGVLVHRLRLD